MSTHSEFLEASSQKAGDLRHRQVIQKAITTYGAKVASTKSTFMDWSAARNIVAETKWDAINHLDRYLEQFEKTTSARGTVVHWAKDADEACQIILDLCRKHQVRKVVKSKSMATEEIHLNHFLEKHSVQPIESDLGEYIIQLRDETPYHIVTPVMHLTKEDIDQTFHEKLGTPTGSTAEELAGTARRVLRNEYITADMGVTGANFIVADTGMISLTENEGNGRLSTALPKIHVAICGIEKVIPSISDLPLFLQILAVSGTGQQLTCYNTLMGGPRQPGERDGPEHFHVILLDNGRTNLLADPEQREALHCIRCGACLNVCPIYKNVGGHAYGTTYQGPIGSVITPHLRGLKEWGHLSSASSLCGACSEACPVHIDIHHHLLQNRRNSVRQGYASFGESIQFGVWKFVMKNEQLFNLSSKAARFSLRWIKKIGLRDPVSAWSKKRTLPIPPKQSFREWWEHRKKN
jgi:L-lactate dehydrogenase complex protein LldF